MKEEVTVALLNYLIWIMIQLTAIYNTMFYTNKDKTQKANLNYSSIPSSPSQTEATNKKKMFARKPAYVVGSLPSEKKKSVLQDSASIIALLKSPTDSLRTSMISAQTNGIKQPSKPVDHSKGVQEKKEGPLTRYREIFYSPKTQKNTLLNGMNLIHRKPSKNHTELKPKDNQQSILRNSFAYRKEISTPFEEDMRRSWKFKTNSVQSFAPLFRSNQEVSESINSGQRSIMQQKSEKSISIECQYCFSHKKRAELLAEKQSKLQQQLNQKVQLIRQLTSRCENLTKQKSQLCQKLEIHIQKLQVKEEEYFRMREQFTHRIDTHKKDIIRLNQTNKYIEIEKSMLIRFKNDYQSITKECQQLKYENDQYKKQIIALANRSHGYYNKNQFISPEKSGSNESSPRQFAKKTKGDSQIYYDCEDDAVSLNLSQHSLDYA